MSINDLGLLPDGVIVNVKETSTDDDGRSSLNNQSMRPTAVDLIYGGSTYEKGASRFPWSYSRIGTLASFTAKCLMKEKKGKKGKKSHSAARRRLKLLAARGFARRVNFYIQTEWADGDALAAA